MLVFDEFDRILQQTGVRHAALFAWDDLRRGLTLLAESGLSLEARERLQAFDARTVDAWDLPFQTIDNRRVYLIGTARSNPLVPALFEREAQAALESLALVPLYAEGRAAGVLLLASVGAALLEVDLMKIREPQRALARRLLELAASRRRARPAPLDLRGRAGAPPAGTVTALRPRGPVPPLRPHSA